MNLAGGYRHRNEIRVKHLKNIDIGLNSDTHLTIKLPDSRVLYVISRSLFLAIVILTLPSIGSFIRGSSSALYDAGIGSDLIDFEFVPSLFRDFEEGGLLKKGHRALIVGSGIDDLDEDLQFLVDNDIDLVIESDLSSQSLIPNGTYDFIFTASCEGTKFIDRVLKIDGIVVTRLNNGHSNEFQQHSNYKIVYLWQFDSTMVAMRKIGLLDSSVNSLASRRLFGVSPEAQKAALRGLEDALLEPPRQAFAGSSNLLKNVKFLPDLLADSLESYRRRIFVTDERNGVIEWFWENYPTRNQYFEIHNLEAAIYDMKVSKRSLPLPPVIGISDWLMKNVREEDYVVMKAEAGAVEEMMGKKTVYLVDELFLECNNQWLNGGKKEKKSKRAYWQCLDLYGRLRDEGVAVHQWWG